MVVDARRAEALFIVALAGLILALGLASYLAWGLLVARGSLSLLAFGLLQGSAVLVLGLTSLVGFKSAIEVTCTSDALQIRQGARQVRIAVADLTSVESIPALRYYRHDARYAATQGFVNHPERSPLLLRTAAGDTVALGLTSPDQDALISWLDAQRATEQGMANIKHPTGNIECSSN